MESIINEYIGIGIGVAGRWNIPPPYHCMQGGDGQPVGGRFHIWCTGGDPTTPDDDGLYLNFSHLAPPGPGDKWGAFELMVDAISADDDDGGMRVWTRYERGGRSVTMGDVLDGGWETLPYHDSRFTNVLRGVWYPSPVEGIMPDGSAVEINPIRIRCELEVKLMRDTARFKWVITNEDNVEHLIGIRSYADLVTSMVDDGTEGYRNVISIPGHPLIYNRTVLHDKEVPSEIELFNSANNPVHSIRLTFQEQGASYPDVVGIDEWRINAGQGWSYWYGAGVGADPMTHWRYEPMPYRIIDDVAYGAFWRPRRVLPTQSVTYIHYIGLASATSDFTRPNLNRPQYVAALQGPRTMQYYNDFGVGALYPHEFPITAYLYNLERDLDINNASFTLTLPPGLELVESEAGKYSKYLNRIDGDAEGNVTWMVKPVGSPTGILEYAVSYSAGLAGGTTVKRQINIPATGVQPLKAGWQMVSVPFNMKDTDPRTALGIQGEYGRDFIFWKYNTQRGEYESVYSLVPGEAYWLALKQPQTTNLQGDYNPIPWMGTQGHQIHLRQGWNLIGNPFVYTFTMGEVRFYHRDYGIVNYEEAIEYGLINRSVFWWDPIFRQYRWSSERTAQIKPWQGYWVRALRHDVTAIMTPISQIGAAIGGVPINGDGTIDPIQPPPAP